MAAAAPAASENEARIEALVMTDDEAREYLHQTARQNESAFKRLFVAFMPSVRQMAWSVLHSEDDAQEVVNHTFLAVWQQADGFESRDGSTVKTWIIGIARNQALMQLRSRKRHDGHTSIDDHAEILVGTSAVPGDERWLAADALTRCTNELPPHLREILILRGMEGLTNKEAGEVLGRPDGTIKRLYHEAWNLVRACLGKGGFEAALPA